MQAAEHVHPQMENLNTEFILYCDQDNRYMILNSFMRAPGTHSITVFPWRKTCQRCVVALHGRTPAAYRHVSTVTIAAAGEAEVDRIMGNEGQQAAASSQC
jgi:hypothetical protein